MTAKWQYGDTDAAEIFSLTSVAPNTFGAIAVTNAASGLFTITLYAAATSALPAHRVDLVYELLFTDASSKPFTLGDGILYVSPNVSDTTP